MQKNKHQSFPNYEEAIAELESIVRQMESEHLTLAQSLSAYQRGSELLMLCQKSLTEAEQQIRIVSEENKLISFNPDKE
ncbi:MAG: exodeoxyribonuclease VII small subunit [Methylophilaceae bacterium]|nr:exodeoxyribonuclease VII small subunit [Methylophilaceae bacterium]